MAYSSNTRVSDTATNPEEPSQSSAGSNETSSIFGALRSGSGSIPGTSWGASSGATGAAYLTPSAGSSTSTPHLDSSSESSTARPTRDVRKMILDFMKQGDCYTAACIKVGYIIRHDVIRKDFARNGYNDVPYDPEEKRNVYTKPIGSGRK